MGQHKLFWLVVSLTSAAVLVYRGVWARNSSPGSVSYQQGYIVSFALYFLVGLLIGQSQGIRWGILGGAVVAGVEVTSGVALAYYLGAYGEQAKALLARPSFVLLMLVLQVLFGALLGALGATVTYAIKWARH